MTIKKQIIGLFLAVLVLLAGLSYPAYRQIRIWRANTMATQAEAFLAAPETISRAWELAHAANALEPEDPEIARTLARVYAASDPASAYKFWQKVVHLSGGAADDRLELAKAYLQAGMWEEFEAEIAAQREAHLHIRQLDYLQALAATRRSEFEKALQLAAALVKHKDAPHEADALFFQLTRLFQEPEIRQAGIDHLQQIARQKGPRQEEALRALAQLPDLQAQDIRKLIETIDSLAEIKRETRLLAQGLKLRLPNADSHKIYQDARALFDEKEPEKIAILGRWLNRHGLHQYTDSAIPLELARTRQDLFLIYADGLALSHDWDAILSLLDQPRLPVEDYLREAFRMRAFVEKGDMRRARLAWDRALLASSRESSKLYYLAKNAAQLLLPEFEIAALERVIESPPLRKAALSDLIEVHERLGRTEALLKALLDYRRFFPEDTDAANDTRYIKFLLGETNSESLAEAKALLETQTHMLAYRMTLVLGLLREERSAEALGLLDQLPVNWFNVRDRWRLLAAYALHRQGFQNDADKLAEAVDSAKLLPEEKLLLEAIQL